MEAIEERSFVAALLWMTAKRGWAAIVTERIGRHFGSRWRVRLVDGGLKIAATQAAATFLCSGVSRVESRLTPD